MRYLRLFEEMGIDIKEIPLRDGHNLSPRERKILSDLVGEFFEQFHIKVEDHYYYTRLKFFNKPYYNRFDDFNELRDYVLFWYHMLDKRKEELIKLIKTTKLDPSFDDNYCIKWARLRSSEIIGLLLKDERVRSKLTEEEIDKMKYLWKYGSKISH